VFAFGVLPLVDVVSWFPWVLHLLLVPSCFCLPSRGFLFAGLSWAPLLVLYLASSLAFVSCCGPIYRTPDHSCVFGSRLVMCLPCSVVVERMRVRGRTLCFWFCASTRCRLCLRLCLACSHRPSLSCSLFLPVLLFLFLFLVHGICMYCIMYYARTKASSVSLSHRCRLDVRRLSCCHFVSRCSCLDVQRFCFVRTVLPSAHVG